MRNFQVQLLIAAVAVAAAAILAAAEAGEEFSWIQKNSLETCQGSIAECVGELEMGSEINRRILATKAYIGYGALKPNTVPCPYRGASYYNCRNVTQANPYGRSCTAVTKCRNG